MAGDELEKVVRAGGFEGVRVQTLPFETAFESVELHWEIMSEMAPPVKAAREALEPADLARLKTAIGESLRPYMDGGRVILPATCVCALATM